MTVLHQLSLSGKGLPQGLDNTPQVHFSNFLLENFPKYLVAFTIDCLLV
jgi:hypothetical protein